MSTPPATWTRCDAELPPEGELVWTMLDDAGGQRNITQLVRQGNLWFAGSMYVYYTPTHWSR